MNPPLDDYLQTYNRENVALVTEKIQEVTETGVKTADGRVHEVDTGYLHIYTI